MGQDMTGNSNTSEEKKPVPERAAFVPLWVAVVTGIVTITVALLSSPLLERWLAPTPTPSPVPVLTATLSLSPTPAEIILPVETSTPEIISSNTAAPDSPSPTSSVAAEMFVRIAASQTTGKAPFTVKFDARDSYVQAPDGTIYDCSKGACRYGWYIFFNGQEFARPDTTRGTLDFRFQQKGTYSISVYICHGSESPTCGNAATLVIAD